MAVPALTKAPHEQLKKATAASSPPNTMKYDYDRDPASIDDAVVLVVALIIGFAMLTGWLA